MDRFTSMQVFCRVVEAGSFARAAARMDLSPAAVTTHVNRLEAHLGTRLLNRTTRRVSVTEAGAAFHERCVALLADLEEAEAVAGQHSREARGLLRITAPADFAGLHLGAPVAAFMRLHQGVRVDLDGSNRLVDIVEEGYDLAVRVAPRLESSLVARRIASSSPRRRTTSIGTGCPGVPPTWQGIPACALPSRRRCSSGATRIAAPPGRWP